VETTMFCGGEKSRLFESLSAGFSLLQCENENMETINDIIYRERERERDYFSLLSLNVFSKESNM
jgi:hypothetical protein